MKHIEERMSELSDMLTNFAAIRGNEAAEKVTAILTAVNIYQKFGELLVMNAEVYQREANLARGETAVRLAQMAAATETHSKLMSESCNASIQQLIRAAFAGADDELVLDSVKMIDTAYNFLLKV